MILFLYNHTNLRSFCVMGLLWFQYNIFCSSSPVLLKFKCNDPWHRIKVQNDLVDSSLNNVQTRGLQDAKQGIFCFLFMDHLFFNKF